MKVEPSTASFAEGEKAPALTYQFYLEEAGTYAVELLTAPTNPSKADMAMHLQVASAAESKVLEMVPADFKAGDTKDMRWCKGVLDQVRITATTMEFDGGVQTLTISPLESGLVLERVRIYPVDVELKKSYLGPATSCRA